MKDKEIKIRANEEFIEKVDYLQKINGYKNRSDTVRKVVEKEYRKEKMKTYFFESEGAVVLNELTKVDDETYKIPNVNPLYRYGMVIEDGSGWASKDMTNWVLAIGYQFNGQRISPRSVLESLGKEKGK